MKILTILGNCFLKRKFELITPYFRKELRYSFSYLPFKHLVIDDFLPPDLYKNLATRVEGYIQSGKLGRFELYDLYSFRFTPSLEDRELGVFYTQEWFRFLEEVFGLPLSRDFYMVGHHHKPSEKDNYIHTDFEYGCFVDDPLPTGINMWKGNCDYTALIPEKNGRKMARVLAAVYYVNNAPWTPGLGGETGMYYAPDVGALYKKIAPQNNRMLIFEISPKSYHNFMKNNATSRNSIAQWYFVSPEEAGRRYPDSRPAERNQ